MMWLLYKCKFFSDILCSDMSLLFVTVTLRGISNKHCLLSLFSFLLTPNATARKRNELTRGTSWNELTLHSSSALVIARESHVTAQKHHSFPVREGDKSEFLRVGKFYFQLCFL